MSDQEDTENLFKVFDMARGHLMTLWAAYLTVLGLFTGSAFMDSLDAIAIRITASFGFLCFVTFHLLST
jgi:hypothetical protein